jgi:hypothetical protein
MLTRIWSEMMDDLNRVVDYLLNGEEQEFHHNFRMADFADFGWKAMRSRYDQKEDQNEMGQIWLETLGKLSQAQTEEMLIDDPTSMCLEVWMENLDNHGRELRSKDLFVELKTIGENHNIEMPFRGAQGFGRKMNQIVSNLSEYYRVKKRIGRNRVAFYSFFPNDENDENDENE